MTANGIEERIAAMRKIKPSAAGMCANTVWRSLNVPPLGTPDATAVVAKVLAAKKLHAGAPATAPRGSVMLWTGGSAGHGHAALSLGGGRMLSTDVNGPRTVGEADAVATARRWGLKWAGWTNWYGVNLPMADVVTAAKYVKLANFKVPAGQWITYAEGTLLKGVHFLVTAQFRIPAGCELEFRIARVGWGNPADTTAGIDGTGYQWFPARKGGSQGQSRTHPMAGGGKVAWQVRAVKAVTLPTLVAKFSEG